MLDPGNCQFSSSAQRREHFVVTGAFHQWGTRNRNLTCIFICPIWRRKTRDARRENCLWVGGWNSVFISCSINRVFKRQYRRINSLKCIKLRFSVVSCIRLTFCPYFVSYSFTANGLRLPEGGDFEALHFQLSRNFDRSTKLELTTESPLLGRCCYRPLD